MMLIRLFLIFFKIGAFTFGGGYAMLPLVREAVISEGWLTENQILDFIAVSESTPGPFAINIATFVGMEKAGIAGAAVSTLGVVLPSFIIIYAVAHFYEKFKTNSVVTGCMSGLRPAVIGLILSAVISMGLTVFFPAGIALSVFSSVDFYISAAIFAVMLFLILKLKANPILIIVFSAAAGIAAGYAQEFI